jgi:lipopolysaccharide/colanic/teichoic acid biosynthesis glycosyltransferase
MTIGFRHFQLPHSNGHSGQTLSSAPIDATTLPPQKGMYRRFFKRALDLTAVVLSLPVVAPVVGALALMVVLDGGKPFYSQMRVGRHGKRFRMWKLRTMVPDADMRMADYLESNPDARTEWDQTQKLKSDPRITRSGHFLRQTSLDELPQLWNVLIGEMSLVGPRPMMLSQQNMYPGTAYFALRPGLTGYWQTAERNCSTFAARAEYDTNYEADLSLATDLKLLVLTVGVVVKSTGH